MKTLFSLLIATLVFLPVRLAFGQLIYEVEPNHSTGGFSVPIAGGITRVSGKFMDFQIPFRMTGITSRSRQSPW